MVSSSIALDNMSSISPPTLEENLSHSHSRSQDNDQRDSQDTLQPRSSTSTEKGKAKQLDEDVIEYPCSESYPPMNDDAAETRRVEENLRRWELAERERRRAARDSAHVNRSGSGPSLLGEVTRRASVLLSKRPSVRSSARGLGDHRALQSRDSIDVVPLDDIESPPATANPFIHPSETRPGFISPPLSPFLNSKERSSVMTDLDSNTHSSQPTMLPPTPTFIPPPQQLGLSAPLTPPPKSRMTPMKPTPPPMLHREPIEPEQDVRWWHDWLCGCSEGPDRGGDNQAGRTNPFE
ncbi:uncharacterized protein EDB93DRAFT_1094153 [Suillus bovinus]|uniref:uncharacterized protein n=1 Tax=Suillus bovinus TaxID=48563 RepID=UPI001B87685A|nr:uncharacterized protein EDB93DRAFT_1094153 [Suillus bovinus]KAG2132015.1 hypothetical protein EDB93DRAFT_1094153 [Suillus bovinus]